MVIIPVDIGLAVVPGDELEVLLDPALMAPTIISMALLVSSVDVLVG